MKTWIVKGMGLVVLAVGLVGSAVGTRGDDFQAEEGYTLLFNGKDLTGWEYHGTKLDGQTATPDKRIEVIDGVIVAQAKDANGKGGIRNLFTVRQFPNNFHLKLEFRAGLKADSGVYLRAVGKQLQVRDYIRRGERKQLKNFKDDDWNELDITVTGNEAVCKCNGEMLETMKGLPATGGIGLQAETGKFEFRRIRVKELP
ncbi:MAG: DUF1080 domain-containing protein [Gemmataceae bacterium]